MSTKIYCKQCKHKRFHKGWPSGWHDCIKGSPNYFEEGVLAQCHVKNHNNDCLDFEEEMSVKQDFSLRLDEMTEHQKQSAGLSSALGFC